MLNKVNALFRIYFKIGVFCEKKPYRKPVLNKVNLVAEEAVLGVCKNNTQAGPNQSGCIIPQCFNEGS